MDRPRSAQLGQATRPPDDTPAWAEVPWWALALIFTPVYLFAIILGYAFFLTPNSISALWPAGGVALATLTLTRYRMWPMLLLLITGIEISIPYLFAGAEIVANATLGNVIEPLIGASLLRWIVGRRVDVSRMRDAINTSHQCRTRRSRRLVRHRPQPWPAIGSRPARARTHSI